MRFNSQPGYDVLANRGYRLPPRGETQDSTYTRPRGEDKGGAGSYGS